MAMYTTEITSSAIISDNPIHQRLFYAYHRAQEYIKGDLLEIGCGDGRGLEILVEQSDSYTGIDKNDALIAKHSKKYPKAKFLNMNIPPFSGIEDNSFDTVVTFQVIEHIKDHKKFVEEIYRVLKPGGKALITTPNKKLRLARNPWHVREYTAEELTTLVKRNFSKVERHSITGNEKVQAYFEQNKKSVRKYTKWDIFNLQYAIPAPILRIPYDYLNRKNRNQLLDTNDTLTREISFEDHSFTNDLDAGFDLFFVCEK